MPDRHHRGARGAAEKMRRFVAGIVFAALSVIGTAGILAAQSPTPPAASGPVSDLNQLMRGLFFPHSNVVFLTQRQDPGAIKWAAEPSASTDPLTGVFGSWQAVENSALVIAEAADLLMTPGRKCSNGRDVPLTKPDWVRMVNQLREAGLVAYKAAQTKDREKMIMASDVLNTSCAECHNKYRNRAASRCQ